MFVLLQSQSCRVVDSKWEKIESLCELSAALGAGCLSLLLQSVSARRAAHQMPAWTEDNGGLFQKRLLILFFFFMLSES
jgi:hypothetical protein